LSITDIKSTDVRRCRLQHGFLTRRLFKAMALVRPFVDVNVVKGSERLPTTAPHVKQRTGIIIFRVKNYLLISFYNLKY
jgi:hypothetical protein